MKNKLIKYLLLLPCLFFLLLSRAQVKPFRFAWLTDIHVVRGSSHIEDLKKSVNNINSMTDIQFTILTGDISDFGYGEDLRIAKSILDELIKPYYIVPGNHDTKWSESGATVFQDIFGHRNISFNYGNFEFIGFQTGPILRRGDGYIAPGDLKWVAKQLADAKKKGRTIVPFTHYPLTKSMSNWYKLVDLFKEYSVPVVLTGHGHRNQKLSFEGLPGVMARTNPGSHSSRGDNPVGYTIVDVTSDSIYFREINPEISKTTLWHQLPISPIQFAKNSKHTPNLSVNAEYPNAKLIWQVNLTGGISSSAACSGNKVIVGDREGILHCLSLNTGKKQWQFKAGKSIFSTPAIEGNRVVFGSADNYIYCLNINDGKLFWKFQADKWVLGSPVINEGKVYIGASDENFRALDLVTGKLIWEYGGIKGWIETKPVIYHGKVFFGAWDNYFYALDKQSGKLAWRWIRSPKESYPSSFYAPGACWPVAANNRIFIAGPDMVLTALNAETGDTLWRTGNPRINEAIGISEDGSKVFVKCTFDSTLLAYSTIADTPQILWKTIDHYGFDDNQSAIAEKNGTVYFTFRNGLAIAVNSNTGNVLWKHKVDDVMLNAATPVNNNEVILTDVDGNVLLISSK